MIMWALVPLKPGKSFNTYRASTFSWDYCGSLCFSTAWPSSDHFIYSPAQASNHNSKMSWPGSPDGIFYPFLPGWSGCMGCMTERCIGGFDVQKTCNIVADVSSSTFPSEIPVVYFYDLLSWNEKI